MRQRRLLYNDKGANSSRIYNNHKYICIQHWRTKYIKETLTDMNRELENSVIILEDFNALFSVMDRSFRQKITKEMLYYNHTLSQMNLTSIIIKGKYANSHHAITPY